MPGHYDNKGKGKPSVNPVGVNKHNLRSKTEFPGIGVSLKGEKKPTFPRVGKAIGGVALIPLGVGFLAVEGAKSLAKMADKKLIKSWDDRNVRNRGTKLNPKEILTNYMNPPTIRDGVPVGKNKNK